MNLEPHFINPFDNSIVPQVIIRLTLLYLVSIILILIIKKGNIRAALSSNLGQRIIGWLILTPLYFIATFAGGIPGLIILFIFTLGAILEFSKISKLNKDFKYALIFLSFVSLMVAGFFPEVFYSLPLIYFIVTSSLAIRLNMPDKSFMQASISMYGSIWIIFSLSHLVLLTRLSREFDATYALTLVVIFAVALADIGGYIFGKLFHKLNILDKYKVADKLSPNKTYIGTLGYIIGALLGISIFYFAVSDYMSALQWLIVGVIIGVFSFIGGLTHSYFKRYFGVKDSGKIIPGHGGIMDRIDSISRVGVILYYFLLFFIV